MVGIARACAITLRRWLEGVGNVLRPGGTCWAAKAYRRGEKHNLLNIARAIGTVLPCALKQSQVM